MNNPKVSKEFLVLADGPRCHLACPVRAPSPDLAAVFFLDAFKKMSGFGTVVVQVSPMDAATRRVLDETNGQEVELG